VGGKLAGRAVNRQTTGRERSNYSFRCSKLTDFWEQLLCRIVFEPGGGGLAIAYKAIKIEKSYFSTIFALSRQANPASVKDFSMEI